ncbi:MFS transporter [Aciduricibacillus chroicocephali]|uniref:MFS transporter n=1 Tax=Aciduricibacillus chroicocephali TaxID=3054939 RepID=A0ABY9KWX9_9BACI|nr:MFS transporter [Bacillaceae bacterium 44XB]
MGIHVKSARVQFWFLMGIVVIAGFSQGMLMPVVSILLEKDGVSASLNGMNTAAVYLGILLAAPFMEKILRKAGFRNGLIAGGLLVVVSLALFPVWKSFWFWFALRFVIGLGDSVLQIGAQTWITTFSPKNRRGLNVALFGLCFGLGFGIGPMMTNLLSVNEELPFLASAVFGLIALIPMFFMQNQYPMSKEDMNNGGETKHVVSVLKYAWVALLFPLGYGFLEATLNGNFPVYALQSGIRVSEVAIILPAFAIGSVILQLPLGSMSDKFGRKRMLTISLIIGITAFTMAGLLQKSTLALMICFAVAGMFVGSIYSLGVTYMVDLLPPYLLTVGNTLCSVLYSVGSLAGPIIGGASLQYIKGINFFFIIGSFLLVILVSLAMFRPREVAEDSC